MRQSLIPSVGVIADLGGTELTAADETFLQNPLLTGLILFARNYSDPQQLKSLTAAVRAVRPDLLITADQEGGRVQRFRTGFTRFAPMLTLETLFREDPEVAVACARDGGWLLASELAAHGVDLTFAPVLDIERDCSRVIGDRAFGHTADVVTRLAGAWCEGLKAAGMRTVGKHFPGHGAVVADSHHELPVDPRSAEELEYDIQPCASLINRGAIDGIMPAHVVYPAIDAERTAGFSARWLQHRLRAQLGFTGVIFSDDLSMAGAASGGDFYQRSFAAAEAGANALVVCNNRDAALEVLRAATDLHESGRPVLNLAEWKVPVPQTDINEIEAVRARLRLHGLITE